MKSRGFALVEVVISIAIAGTAFAGVLYGYVLSTDKAKWSGYSLAAQSLAQQCVEQARSAVWTPQTWPPVDELAPTNYVRVEALDAPGAGTQSILATNYVSITSVSANPPLRQLRADCVWVMPGRGASKYGPFTNTVITLRTSDQ